MGQKSVHMEDTTFFSADVGTLVERVMQTIRQRIAGRTLAPGAKVPSIRGFAETLQVSKSTVVEAYERLAAEGLIQSRRGSGFTSPDTCRRCRSLSWARAWTALSIRSGCRGNRWKLARMP